MSPLLEAIAEGDMVAVRFEVQATHTGIGLPYEPTGRAVKFMGISMLEVEDGKLKRAWNSWDQLGMLIQLGVISDSATADKMLEPSTGEQVKESAA